MGEPDAERRAQELLERGATLYEGGKLYEALSCWKLALQLDPNNEIAAEYLRFIEDNFQIGVDAFIEHHAPVDPTPPPVVAPPGAGLLPPVASRAPATSVPGAPSAAGSLGNEGMESIEELDWSQILDEGPDDAGVTPPPVLAQAPLDDDEDFFSELDAGSLRARPGEEAAAWGLNGNSPGQSPASASVEIEPEGSEDQLDPMAAGPDLFTAPYTPPLSARHGSVSEEILPGDPRSRRRTGAIETIPGPPPVVSPHAPIAGGPTPSRRDLAQMSDESIELMLDLDFQAWEDSAGRGAVPEPASGGATDDLENLLSRGLSPTPVDEPPLETFSGSFESDPSLVPPPPVSAARGGYARGERRPAPPSPPRPAVAKPVARAVPEPPEPPSLDAYGIADEDGPGLGSRPGRSGEIAPQVTPRPGASGAKAAGGRAGSLLATERSSAPYGSPADSGERPEGGGAGRAAAAKGPARKAHGARPAPVASASEAGPVRETASELELLLRDGLRDIEAAERGDASPVRDVAPAAEPAPRTLIGTPDPALDLDAAMAEARRKQAAGDFTGSLRLVEDVLAGDPNHAEARRYLEENTSRLLGMYRSRLGRLTNAPRVKLRPHEIIWQSLDHRAGFLLSQVDGRTSYEDIIEISGMPELEATRILARLVEHGVIG